MRRSIALALTCLLLTAASATADERPQADWDALVDATAVAFARPGLLEAKRRLVADLAATGRLDAWVLILAALEREGLHLDVLARARAEAWRYTQSLWSLPRGQHHEGHARRLRQSFTALGDADRRWFRERMLVGQMGARLRAAPPRVQGLFRREATSPVGLLHPVARAALAPVLALELDSAEAIADYRQLLERDEDERVRLAALDALPAQGRAVLPLIMRRLRDRSWVVRQAAARALADRAAKDAVAMLEDAARRAGPREAQAHVAALRELGHAAEAPAAGTVTVYGAPVPSKHVVFVLDASAAMAGSIERARAEVEAAIRLLPSDGTFGLVVFHGAVMHWQPHAVPATAANKDAAAAWLATHDAGWNANLDGGLREAFRIAGLAPPTGTDARVDTIVVVAAGRPQAYAPGDAGPIRAGYIERLVGVWNRDKRIRIQGIALSDGPIRTVLQTLARDHGGTVTEP